MDFLASETKLIVDFGGWDKHGVDDSRSPDEVPAPREISLSVCLAKGPQSSSAHDDTSARVAIVSCRYARISRLFPGFVLIGFRHLRRPPRSHLVALDGSLFAGELRIAKCPSGAEDKSR